MLNNKHLNHQTLSYWCVVSGSTIWLDDGVIPYGSSESFQLPLEHAVQIGEHKGAPLLWVDESLTSDSALTPRNMVSLRDCLEFTEQEFLLLSRAVQFGHMIQSERFCPQCGGRNHLNHNQLAMQCNDCRTLHYPRIFPCIIVAVRKQGQILLAQHPRHKTGMYTVIAGFVEIGETLEQCVAREVMEETGITVTNIRYFGSQPWAFPSSMMMAYLADYESGTVKPDYTELSDARWYSPDELPELAPKGTIARELIEHTVAQIRAETEN